MQDVLAEPTFADVARTIAKGKPPPDWLPQALEHFSAFVGTTPTLGTDRKGGRDIIERMNEAADVLLCWLPAFNHLPLGPVAPVHPDATVVLDALPRLKRDFERVLSTSHPANAQREVCAAVVLAAWRLIHGEPEPRSGQTEQACADYWQACGGAQIGETGDRENWRRPIERALDNNHSWVREILTGYKRYTTDNK